MRPEDLVLALGDIDDVLLTRAEAGQKLPIRRYVALAASLCIVLGIGLFLKLGGLEAFRPQTLPDDPPITSPIEPFCFLKVAVMAETSGEDYGITDAVSEFCEENRFSLQAYRPVSSDTSDRRTAMESAIREGCSVLLLPGQSYEAAMTDLQDEYPNVYFVGIGMDGSGTTLSENATALGFNEAESGYLAGYAAVSEGYTQLGYYGTEENDASLRFAYGFLQGADAAAAEQGNSEVISLRYGFAAPSFDASGSSQTADEWFRSGTELILTDSTELSSIVSLSANEIGGKVMTCGTALSYGDALHCGEFRFDRAALYVLSELKEEHWTTFAGKSTTLSLSDGAYIGTPDGQWSFENFSAAQYASVMNELASGQRKVTTDIASPPEVSVKIEL